MAIDQSFDATPVRWAEQLGLAASPLFPAATPALEGSHFALLDGRRASFVCSQVAIPDVAVGDSQDWRWSADLPHHVLVRSNTVEVRSGRERLPRVFGRASVESHLDDFVRFLDTSRFGGLPDVVAFLLEEFAQMWALVPGKRPRGNEALAAFLVALRAADKRDATDFGDRDWRTHEGKALGLNSSAVESLDSLSSDVIERGRTLQTRAPGGLRVLPDLVLRHAAGRLFQDAHGYLEVAQRGLFGDSSIATVPTFSPSGAFFTPVSIARLVAEAALQNWTALPPHLVIADYACGSAIFLTEALRVLERRGFRGTVRLIGRDISDEAVTMATVAIATAARDLRQARIEIDVSKVDAIDALPWPQADVALMNPPFRAWEQMDARERDWARDAIAGFGRGRPDLCVGFAEHALRAVRGSGVLATLLPAGVLASEQLVKWRESLLERTTPSLVAVLGDHGLFRHALVNVGVVVLRKVASASLGRSLDPGLSVAWASPDAGAASQAIRALRRVVHSAVGVESSYSAMPQWSVTQTSLSTWRTHPTWLPGPGALGRMMDLVRASVPTTVEDLFHVRQGVRTGAKDVFLLSDNAFAKLPRSERRFFRQAVDTASFNEGELNLRGCLFSPDPAWRTEAEVQSACPHFFETVLLPAKTRLSQRRDVKGGRWWELARARGWMADGRPRLVSKRFGLYPAFARDIAGKLAIVQGNAWIPHDRGVGGTDVEESAALVTSYWWLLNSRVAVSLFREFCPNVAGGQLDLEHKYVKHVPMPHLKRRFLEDPSLQELALRIRARSKEELPSLADRDAFAASAFGTSASDWPLARFDATEAR